VKIAILVFVAAVGLPSVALAQGPELLAAATVIVDAFGRHDPEAYFALFDPDEWIAVHEHLSPAPEASDAAASNELVPSDIAGRLVGAWEAVEDQGLGPDGEVVARDTTVVGLLVYTPEGRMAVQLMYQGRPEVSTANDEVSITGLGRIGWDAEDARAAIDTYDAYFGSYEIDRDRNLVTHVVVGELRPPGVGARYGRRFEFHGDELWLTPENPAEGWRVVWRRVR
jgi:hypothetical protein